MAAYNYQPAEVNDFSGGETDIYINAPTNQAQTLDNFFILDNKRIRTRPGQRLDDALNPQVPHGAQRIGKLLSVADNTLLVQSLNKFFYRNPSAYSSLLGPTGGNPFLSTSNLVDYAHAKWNKIFVFTSDVFEKPIKIYPNQSGVWQMRTAGLPALASSPSGAGTAGTNSYLYAFAYEYEYYVNDQLFLDVGPVTQVQVLSVNAPNVNSITVSSIPTLANGAGDNYDTANIKIGVYRSLSGGTALYKLGTVSNGTTSYIDTTSDATLADREPLYTNDDTPDNDPPPLAKYVHTVGSFTYFAHIKQGTQVFPNKILQSQNDDPDSVPTDFEDILDDEITGISSVQNIPILGCQKYIYALEGNFDSVGRGGITHKRLSDHAGCVSHESFVQAESKLFWAGRDGFYVTDGNTVQKVSDHLNDRYLQRVKTLGNNKKRIKGKYDPSTRMIHWTFSQTAQAIGGEDCDIIWSVDLKWGVRENMVFHIWSGSENFWPTAIEVHNDQLYRGDRYGYVLKFSTEYLTDIKIDITKPVSQWGEEAIIYTYRSVASNFGTSAVRKVASKVLLSCANESNLSVAIEAINDDGKLQRALTPIRWRRNFVWGDEDFVWGSPEFVWSYGGLIEVDRRFPAKGLRFNYLQLEFTNDFSNIINSDTLGQVTVNAGSDTCTLVDTVNGDWPLLSIDYVMYFSFDNYTQGFKVTTRGADTLVLEDISSLLQSGTWDFQMKGYKKGEILSLNEYSILWAPTSRSHDMYNKGDNGSLDGK